MATTKKKAGRTWLCPNGHKAPVGAKFCPECGVAKPVDWKCARCGEKNHHTANFCSNCGAPSTLVPVPPVVPTPPEKTPGQRFLDEIRKWW